MPPAEQECNQALIAIRAGILLEKPWLILTREEAFCLVLSREASWSRGRTPLSLTRVIVAFLPYFALIALRLCLQCFDLLKLKNRKKASHTFRGPILVSISIMPLAVHIFIAIWALFGLPMCEILIRDAAGEARMRELGYKQVRCLPVVLSSHNTGVPKLNVSLWSNFPNFMCFWQSLMLLPRML